jgi:hypothetical protein
MIIEEIIGFAAGDEMNDFEKALTGNLLTLAKLSLVYFCVDRFFLKLRVPIVFYVLIVPVVYAGAAMFFLMVAMHNFGDPARAGFLGEYAVEITTAMAGLVLVIILIFYKHLTLTDGIKLVGLSTAAIIVFSRFV